MKLELANLARCRIGSLRDCTPTARPLSKYDGAEVRAATLGPNV
jgi:hypothetical protein